MALKGGGRGRGARRRSRSEDSQPQGGNSGAKATSVGPFGMEMAPTWFTRSSVYRKVPASIRGRLDAALLLRPAGCETLEAIDKKYDISGRYGISLTSLGRYARNLERLVRPAVASQVMAGVLGCLPEDFRRRLFNGSQVLLLSRVNQALNDEQGAGLSVAELAKLADVLKGLAQCRAGASARRSKADKHKSDADSSAKEMDPSKLAEAVRALYGLTWPPDATHREPIDGQTNESTDTPEDSRAN